MVISDRIGQINIHTMTRNINVPNFVPNFKDARDAHELETSNSDVDISK